jgi:hypothetical protein
MTELAKRERSEARVCKDRVGRVSRSSRVAVRLLDQPGGLDSRKELDKRVMEQSSESSNEREQLLSLSVTIKVKVMKQDIEALYTSGLRVVGGRKR